MGIKWEITRQGRAWRSSEAIKRFHLAPEKIEMCDGKLFWDDEQRLTMLGLVLENIGLDQAVKLGDPALWHAAVADLR